LDVPANCVAAAEKAAATERDLQRQAMKLASAANRRRLLAVAVPLGLALNASLGWWRADLAAGIAIIYHAVKEARTIHTGLLLLALLWRYAPPRPRHRQLHDRE
jgi:hypothetical protein